MNIPLSWAVEGITLAFCLGGIIGALAACHFSGKGK